jgi:osmotically-inducible protein OsmY
VSKSQSQFQSQEVLLVDRIKSTFAQLGYSQLNAIGCSVEDGEVLLTGEINSFYLKQVAQSVAIKVPGVKNIRNEIHVT